MKVPFLDLEYQYLEIKAEIEKSLKEIFLKGDFILGGNLRVFEKNFSEYCGVKYGIGVNSGTDALFLSLKALGVDRGDEVIVPAFTYIASSLAISYTGATPVFCDIEDRTYNINPELIEDKITDNTKAIIVVHLYGHSADMNAILEIAKKHNLKVIEDCAQAHGCLYRGRKVGSIGDVGCFSFYPSKNLGAFGDGGFIVTDDENIKNHLNKLRDYGRRDKYHHEKIGYNSRLDTVQAAILNAKLRRLDVWNDMRRMNAKYYSNLLFNQKDIVVPVEEEYAKHVYHIYGIRVKNGKRDRVFNRLKERNIGVIIHYPIPLHLQEAYKGLGYREGEFPVGEKVASEIMSIPMYPGMRRKHIEEVVMEVERAIK